MKHYYFDLLRLWVRNYFKHPVENIRQANPIVPGRLYHNFGNVCKATPYTKEERRVIGEECQARIEAAAAVECPEGITPEGLLEMARSVGNRKTFNDIPVSVRQTNIPPNCLLCDFHRMGIPCPIYNVLEDGTAVCDTHRYVIIKKAPSYV